MIKDVLENALANAEYCSELRTMLHMIYSALNDGLSLRKYEEEKLEEALHVFSNLLYKKENNAYRSYFMFWHKCKRGGSRAGERGCISKIFARGYDDFKLS